MLTGEDVSMLTGVWGGCLGRMSEEDVCLVTVSGEDV